MVCSGHFGVKFVFFDEGGQPLTLEPRPSWYTDGILALFSLGVCSLISLGLVMALINALGWFLKHIIWWFWLMTEFWYDCPSRGSMCVWGVYLQHMLPWCSGLGLPYFVVREAGGLHKSLDVGSSWMCWPYWCLLLVVCFVLRVCQACDCLFVRPVCQVVVLSYCCIHFMHGTISMVRHITLMYRSDLG